MSITETTVRIDRRYLSKRSRNDLECLVLQLLDINEQIVREIGTRQHGASGLCCQLRMSQQREIERLRVDVSSYVDHFKHTFESDSDDPGGERCRRCGLNIRDAVHVRAQ